MRPALRVLTRSLLVFLLLGLAVLPRLAQAETTVCNVITTVPTVITAQGIYCLNQDFNTPITSGAAIDIQANNVVLDMNAHLLGNLAAGPGTSAIGVNAFDRKNITIKNGTIRGFLYGIVINGSTCDASQGHVIEGIRAERSTYRGINFEGVGRGSIIRNNQVVATGGTTLTGLTNVIGIVAGGCEHRVLNNDVIDTFATGGAPGNGIYFYGTDNLAVNNRITTADFGIRNVEGTAKCFDNLTSGVGTPFSGCTLVGVND